MRSRLIENSKESTVNNVVNEADYHIPVLADEAVGGLITNPDGTYVDATLGGGGYAERILKRSGTSKLFAFDTDPAAILFATERLKDFADRLTIITENFATLRIALANQNVWAIDGIVYDLGVSSRQLDTTSIGLSYRFESELDMRLDKRLTLTAKEVVANYDERDLVKIFREYGEEPQAKRIARRITQRRTAEVITTTTQLAAIVGEGIREDKKNSTLSRIFQAIRIEVNDELAQLRSSLDQAIEVVKPGGRIVVVSYHSLEDRIVKELFVREAKPKADEGSAISLKQNIDYAKARLKLITPKPVSASMDELVKNLRARSAKLRIAERI